MPDDVPISIADMAVELRLVASDNARCAELLETDAARLDDNPVLAGIRRVALRDLRLQTARIVAAHALLVRLAPYEREIGELLQALEPAVEVEQQKTA